MTDKPIEIKEYNVKVGDEQMDVFIPQSDDHSYNEYLEVAEIEKTKEQLKKRPPKEKGKASKSDISEVLKEKREFSRRKKSEFPRKYF